MNKQTNQKQGIVPTGEQIKQAQGGAKKVKMTPKQINTAKLQKADFELSKDVIKVQMEHLEKSIENEMPMLSARNSLSDLNQRLETIEKNIKTVERQIKTKEMTL